MTRGRTLSFLGAVVISGAIAAECDGPSRPSQIFITGVSPRAGTMLGATRIAIAGNGFLAGAKVPSSRPENSPWTRPHTRLARMNVIVVNPDGQRGIRYEGYTFEIDPAFAIFGIVTELTEDGEVPVAGVEVIEGTGTYSATTDARGAYRIGDLRRAVSELWISKAG